MTERRVDAVVVGGGVVGTATARVLAERSVDTTLIEQFRIGHDRGSSHGPTRMFRLAYPEPDYVRLAQRAIDSWRELEASAAEPLLVTVGGLYAGSWAEASAVALERCGVNHAWLDPDDAADRFPGMTFDGLDRLLWQPDGAVCQADRTVAAQARLAARAGGVVVEEEEVLRLSIEGDDAVLVTATARLRAAVAVVAAGAWGAELLRPLGLELPLRPAFAQVSYFAPAEPGAPLPPCYIEAELTPGGLASGGYWMPAVDGGTEVKAADAAPGRTVDPRRTPLSVDPEYEAAHRALVERRLPGFDPRPLRSQTCVYTMAPDEDFVLDRVGPVVVGAACSGHAFKFGPLLGEILADLAMGRDPRLPDSRFGIARFLR